MSKITHVQGEADLNTLAEPQGLGTGSAQYPAKRVSSGAGPDRGSFQWRLGLQYGTVGSCRLPHRMVRVPHTKSIWSQWKVGMGDLGQNGQGKRCLHDAISR